MWDRWTSIPGERCQRRHGPFPVPRRVAGIDLARHRSACAPRGIDSTEAGGARSFTQGSVARRELAAARGCTVFLSTGLWNMVWLVRFSARRRSCSLLARDCAKPHPALVSSPGRATSPQISRRAKRSLFASPNSSAIANGLRPAETRKRGPQEASRSCREKNLAWSRHLCSSRFLVLSVGCRIDTKAACHRVVPLRFR